MIVVPIDGDSAHLVEQYRYPVKGRYWELPQGSWEGVEIDHRTLAAAELREETGLVSENLEYIGHLYMAYGYSSHGFHIYVARDLRQGAVDLDAEELGLISKKFKITEFLRMIRDNEIKDSTTVAAIGMLKIKGVKEFSSG